MMNSAAALVRTVGLAAVLLVAATLPAPAQQRVGVNGGVNQEATGAPPGAMAQPLVVGRDVVFNERVVTGDAGQAQLLFLDKSAMSMGPNSDLTIDQFVYDPSNGTGKIAMNTSRGVLRFIGGAVSQQDNAVSLHTSLATIAVRGGSFMVEQTTDKILNVYFIYGVSVTVTTRNGVTRTLRRPGYVISVYGPDSSPTFPYVVTPGVLARLVVAFDGRIGGNGGALQAPTDQNIVASGIDALLSGAGAPGAGPALLNPANLQTIFQVNSAAGAAALSNSTNLTPPPPPVQTLPPSCGDC